MTHLFMFLERFRKDEKGATAIEYGLIAALIAVAAIVGMTAIGDNFKMFFKGSGRNLTQRRPLMILNSSSR